MSQLPRRTLGTNGPEITSVGFGAWATGGGGWSFAWGAQDDDESIAAIRHAVALGVNWIDTAAVYGLGHSEEVVGRAIAEPAPLGAPARVHEVRPALERERPDGGRGARLEPRARARGVRGVAAAARDRGDRPLPVPLARPVGHAARGFLGRDDAAAGRGQGPLHRRLELRRGAARGLREAAPRAVAAAALLDDPPRRRGERDPLVPGARHRRHRLQPDAVGPAHRRLQRRARGRDAAGRLAPARRRTSRSRTSGATWPCATRFAPIAAKHGVSVAAVAVAWTHRLARRHRRHRRRAQRRSRWTAGSRPRACASTPTTSRRSPRRSSGPAPAPARCGPLERSGRPLSRLLRGARGAPPRRAELPRGEARAAGALVALRREARADGRRRRPRGARQARGLRALLRRACTSCWCARSSRALGPALAAPRRVLDLGCGTGTAGAAWALEASLPRRSRAWT